MAFDQSLYLHKAALWFTNTFSFFWWLCICGISGHLEAQNTFQKVYTTGYDVECFGAYQETDGGYIITGIAQVSASSYKVFMTRTDCHGNILWSKAYNTSSTIGNISQRVVETHDHGFMLQRALVRMAHTTFSS
jgi:hypothetical protein